MSLNINFELPQVTQFLEGPMPPPPTPSHYGGEFQLCYGDFRFNFRYIQFIHVVF